MPDTAEPASPTLTHAKLVLEYVKVLAWPLFIAGLLLVYRPPIGRVLASLAAKFEAADSVKIGSLSLEVLQRARDLGNPELGTQIGQLSFNAIEALVRTPRTGTMILLSTNSRANPLEYGLPLDSELDGLLELEKKNLVTFDEPLDKFVAFLRANGKPRESDSSRRSDDHQWFVLKDPSAGDRLGREGYQLTDSGRKAVEAISKAVAAQLSKQ